MSEMIWCNVRVRFPASWGKPWFLDALEDGFCNGGGADQFGDMWSVSGEGNYGLEDGDVSWVLEWLTAHDVPFLATSDSCSDCPGERQFFDPASGDVAERDDCDSDGAAYLSASVFTEIVELAGGSDARVGELVARFFARVGRSLNDCSIDHLPAECLAQPATVPA